MHNHLLQDHTIAQSPARSLGCLLGDQVIVRVCLCGEVRGDLVAFELQERQWYAPMMPTISPAHGWDRGVGVSPGIPMFTRPGGTNYLISHIHLRTGEACDDDIAHCFVKCLSHRVNDWTGISHGSGNEEETQQRRKCCRTVCPISSHAQYPSAVLIWIAGI